ncbi:MAG: YqgE/AlgH family protein [Bacteroidales bacterium]
MELDYNFFDPENIRPPAKGMVLISEPFLQDNYFKRSIVLLAEHTAEGTVGFVLNKPVNLHVSEVINDFPETDALVSLGGPVNTNTLHYIHTLGDIVPNSVKVLDNIYWGGDFNVIKKLVESKNLNKDNIRFFLGYSGWHENQLEDELAENAWVVAEIDPIEIMSPMNKHFWKNTLKKMGKKYEMWSNFPENPQMN